MTGRLALLAAVALAALLAACGGSPETAEQAPSPLAGQQGPATPQPVAATDCADSPAVVVYAQLDWMRVAEAFAKHGYPCAEYYISVAPTEDEDGLFTVPNRDQAARIHAFGERFHAIAPFRVDAWTEWLARNPGLSWEDAGAEWRRRMAEAGYDTARGDIWGVNELPLEMLTDEALLADMRELIHGLSGDGGEADRGLVWMVSPAQGSSDLAGYRSQLVRLLEDEPFWDEMRRSVRFWAQEVYADPASCCVPGQPAGTIAARMNEYFQYTPTVARAEGARAGSALDYLQEAYVPTANAAWGWTEAYGNTALAPDEMERFLSAEVLALRTAQEDGVTGAGIGFAWAPVPFGGESKDEFLVRSKSILEHLAGAVRESYEAGPEAACGGDDGCRCSVDGAAFPGAWRAAAPRR
jgi:hypothetical protein